MFSQGPAIFLETEISVRSRLLHLVALQTLGKLHLNGTENLQ